MHKGPPFNRWTGTSRYSKVFQGLTDLVTTSGLLKWLDSTYNVKVYLFKPSQLLWRQEPQVSRSLSLLPPSPFISPAPALGEARHHVFCVWHLILLEPREGSAASPFYRGRKSRLKETWIKWWRQIWNWVCPTPPSVPFSLRPDVRTPIYWASVLFQARCWLF